MKAVKMSRYSSQFGFDEHFYGNSLLSYYFGQKLKADDEHISGYNTSLFLKLVF